MLHKPCLYTYIYMFYFWYRSHLFSFLLCRCTDGNIVYRGHMIKTLRPGDVYVYLWTVSSLGQVMAHNTLWDRWWPNVSASDNSKNDKACCQVATETLTEPHCYVIVLPINVNQTPAWTIYFPGGSITVHVRVMHERVTYCRLTYRDWKDIYELTITLQVHAALQ